MFGNRISSDELGSGDHDEVNIKHAMFVRGSNGYSNTLALVIDVVGAHDGGELVIHRT